MMLTQKRDHLTREDAMTVAIIEAAVPVLAAARHLLERFQAMIRTAGRVRPRHLARRRVRRTDGLVRPRPPRRSSQPSRRLSSLPWSNGQTEGHITKLKLVKRQMYGRAKLDLLRARLLGAA